MFLDCCVQYSLRSVLMKICTTLYLATFLVVLLVIAGAWLGFWLVQKLVLTEDGYIDTGVAHFVAWSVKIFASVLILQSSVDPLLAAEALACGILASSIFRRLCKSNIHPSYKKSHRTDKSSHRKSHEPHTSAVKEANGPRTFVRNSHSSPIQGSTSESASWWSDTDTFYSTFHSTADRRKISKQEWDKFTKVSTKKALEGLVSSPDFSKWAVVHAERITLAPPSKDTHKRCRWFRWF